MIERTLVRIYGEALFQVAEEKGVVDEIYEELRTLEELYNGSKELSGFLSSPKIDRGDKKRLIQKTFGPHLSTLTQNFLGTLIDKNREILIPYLAGEFKEILDKIHNRIDVEVTSAVPLSDAIQARLRDTLSGLLGKEVILHVKTDPDILGGIIVRVEDKIMDASVQGQFESLRDQLLGNRRRRVTANEDSA
jgi:F-type H+-transporting ATPase subunit delta